MPKLSKRMDKFMLYMLTAGKKALEYGGITEEVMGELDKTKCGILIGSAMGGMKVLPYYYCFLWIIIIFLSYFYSPSLIRFSMMQLKL